MSGPEILDRLLAQVARHDELQASKDGGWVPNVSIMREAAREIERLTKVAHGLEAVIRRTCIALRGSELGSVAEEIEEQAVDVMMGEDKVAT